MRKRRAEAEDKESTKPHRVVMRRRGGFSTSGLSDVTEAEGVPRDINAEVAAAAVRPPAQIAPVVPPEPDRSGATSGSSDPDSLQSISNSEEFSPQNRLRQVGRQSSEYEREYRLTLLHRLLMRKIPLDEIARQLGISVSQVMRDRKELADRLRQAARELNIDEMVGHHQGFYEEVVAMAMRAASNSNSPLPMRLAAMRTALAGNNDLHRFLQAAGVYDVLRFRRVPGGDGQSDIQRMLSLTEELMAGMNRERREEDGDALGEFSGSDNDMNL